MSAAPLRQHWSGLDSAALALGALAAAASAQGGPLFPAELHPTGNDPRDAAAGDLTADGLADLAVAHAAGHVVAVLPGDGQGGFLPRQVHDVGGGAGELALGALGGGAGLDVVVAVPAAGVLAVLLDDGAGGLQRAVFHPAGGTPQSVALGDVDADGDVDAAAAGKFTAAVAVLLGDGAGGFGAPGAVGTPGAVLVDAAFADADQDGDLDLLALNEATQQMLVHAGDGAGGFGAGAAYGACNYQNSMEVGDLDANGYPDVAVATHNLFGDQHQVLMGASGGFTATQAAGVKGTDTLAMADVDGDGDLDLAWPGFDSVSLQVGDGAGAFASPAVDAEVHVAVGLQAPVLADFDQDGVADMAVCAGASHAALILGAGGGAFADPDAMDVGKYAIELEALDADNDGALDLALLQTLFTISGADAVSVALGDGAGGFAAPAQIAGLPLWVGGFDSGDLDSDGVADLVAGRSPGGSSTTPSEAHPFLGDGAGGFAGTGAFPVATGIVKALALADFNQDGVLDVGVGTAYGLVAGGRLGVWKGDGSGGFAAGVTLASGEYFEVAAGDADLDGAPDLAGADWGGDRLVLVRGDGAGGFLASAFLPLGYKPWGAGIADVTGDGLPDLLGSGEDGFDGLVSVLAGDGLGGFAAPLVLETPGRPEALVTGDLDADGHRDLAAVCEDGAVVSLHPADGSGGFEPARLLGAGFEPVALAAADFDADGLLDLATTHRQYTEQRTYLGQRLAPQGTSAFGAGTPGCGGGHGLAASGPPQVGDGGFALISTNAPPEGAGLRLLAAAPDAAGSDPVGLGIVLHVDPFGPFLLADLSFASDAQGQGLAPLPIPPTASLAGATVFAQAVWVWTGPCQPTALGLSSSAGISLTIQP